MDLGSEAARATMAGDTRTRRAHDLWPASLKWIAEGGIRTRSVPVRRKHDPPVRRTPLLGLQTEADRSERYDGAGSHSTRRQDLAQE